MLVTLYCNLKPHGVVRKGPAGGLLKAAEVTPVFVSLELFMCLCAGQIYGFTSMPCCG